MSLLAISAVTIRLGGRTLLDAADLTVDPDIIEDVRAGLRARGETLAEEKYPHASMQLVAWDRTGGRARLLAATDPRKGGMAAAQ